MFVEDISQDAPLGQGPLPDYPQEVPLSSYAMPLITWLPAQSRVEVDEMETLSVSVVSWAC